MESLRDPKNLLEVEIQQKSVFERKYDLMFKNGK